MESSKIDLNNTWCEATDESYSALIELEYIPYNHETRTDYNIFSIKDKTIFGRTNFGYGDKLQYRQIHLVNGQFEYVKEQSKMVTDLICEQETFTKKEVADMLNSLNEYYLNEGTSTEDCLFANYGFEKPDFECEILKEVDGIENQLVGYIRVGDLAEPACWGLDGKCYGTFDDDVNNRVTEYSLTPIKKEWYEDGNNFPTLIVANTDGSLIGAWVHYYKDGKVYDLNDSSYTILGTTNWRLATKEEVLSLYKEQ